MATDGSISVVSGDIEVQAKNLADLKNELERVLDAAQRQVATLIENEGFKGSAGASFQGTYQEWTQANLKSVGLLEEMATYLTKASSAFSEVDSAFTIK